MSTEYPKRIHLLGQGRIEEGKASEAITPGSLVALNSDGEYENHGSAGGYGEALFALEDSLQGKTINDAYAADDIVRIVVAGKGDVVYARLADGEDVGIGDLLTSNGDGTLQKIAGTEKPIAVAIEALDLSESSNTTPGRVRSRIL